MSISKKLINPDSLTKTLKNIVAFSKKHDKNIFIKRAEYLEKNTLTTSFILNNHLTKQASRFSENIPVPVNKGNPKPLILFNALKSTTDPSSDLLTYKGINLGSAINMKLSVQLASLLKDKDL
ncbi:hypothetical protein [Marinospirillum insulare]|uniref:Uncharacterized protein n=1 Tax=Marinospirillum insulare TaxID=217169 RepID=A0ABQ5ZWP2_9GAMM|nr:hypothetical protein [Marinospirillum insulare]GLR63061.1 hypothetical protein GCM10007878_04960 [Marinospirillum insulare]